MTKLFWRREDDQTTSSCWSTVVYQELLQLRSSRCGPPACYVNVRNSGWFSWHSAAFLPALQCDCYTVNEMTQLYRKHNVTLLDKHAIHERK